MDRRTFVSSRAALAAAAPTAAALCRNCLRVVLQPGMQSREREARRAMVCFEGGPVVQGGTVFRDGYGLRIPFKT